SMPSASSATSTRTSSASSNGGSPLSTTPAWSTLAAITLVRKASLRATWLSRGRTRSITACRSFNRRKATRSPTTQSVRRARTTAASGPVPASRGRSRKLRPCAATTSAIASPGSAGCSRDGRGSKRRAVGGGCGAWPPGRSGGAAERAQPVDADGGRRMRVVERRMHRVRRQRRGVVLVQLDQGAGEAAGIGERGGEGVRLELVAAREVGDQGTQHEGERRQRQEEQHQGDSGRWRGGRVYGDAEPLVEPGLRRQVAEQRESHQA